MQSSLKEKIKKFIIERNWDKSHNPKDLITVLVSEVGELAECYRWLTMNKLNRLILTKIKNKNRRRNSRYSYLFN